MRVGSHQTHFILRLCVLHESERAGPGDTLMLYQPRLSESLTHTSMHTVFKRSNTAIQQQVARSVSLHIIGKVWRTYLPRNQNFESSSGEEKFLEPDLV